MMQLAHHAHDVRSDLVVGAIAGQIAGLIMAVAMMAVYALFLGHSPLFPVQVIGSFVTGEAALHGFHLPSLLWGLALHQLGPSLVWGLVFAEVVHAYDVYSVGKLALVGLAVGAISQLVDVNLILPYAFRALHGHNLWAENVPMGWSWVAHLVYGASLASFAWVRARVRDF